ncbi:MAG: restriction endonuclease subunit S, partial [Thermoanaerobaculia bacterium]
LNCTWVREIGVPIPPLSEQERILSRAAAQTARLELAVEKSERQIDAIREYRTRLIADVVTGKLDVREAAAKLREEEPRQEADEPTDDEGSIGDEMDEKLEERAQEVDA